MGVDEIFRALGDPTRREILRLLRGHDMPAGDIAAAFPLAPSTLSGHLKVLKDSGLGIYLLLLFLPRVDPGRANYAQFRGAYTAIRLGTLALLAAIYLLVIAAADGWHPDVALLVPLLLGLLFIVLGSVMGKVRPNWFVGIRTPWTLSSKRSWIKTHRLGGWLFVALGLLLIGSGFTDTPLAGFLLPAVVGVAAILLLYSYLVWRTDPEKLPPAGTLPGPREP